MSNSVDNDVSKDSPINLKYSQIWNHNYFLHRSPPYSCYFNWDWPYMSYMYTHLSFVKRPSVSTWDFEPPSCSFCPGDVIREGLERQVRVNWKRPNCSDNSGIWPTFLSDRQTGALFDVPGSYHIKYTISDFANNVNNNCSFRIILTGNALLITHLSTF